MKLPYRNSAIVSREKLTMYILSESHVVGRFKARLFNAFGFEESNAEMLKKAILAIAEFENVTEKIISPYGTKYIIDGDIDSPRGKTLRVRTIWIIQKGQKSPRFVTCYPV